MVEKNKITPIGKMGRGIVYIINSAITKVVLISPFVDFLNWVQLKTAIERAIERKVEIELYIRDAKNYLNSSVEEMIDMRIDVFLVKNLHAKIYINESNAILSSLNLLSFSSRHSIEAGIFITVKRFYKCLSGVFDGHSG